MEQADERPLALVDGAAEREDAVATDQRLAALEGLAPEGGRERLGVPAGGLVGAEQVGQRRDEVELVDLLRDRAGSVVGDAGPVDD